MLGLRKNVMKKHLCLILLYTLIMVSGVFSQGMVKIAIPPQIRNNTTKKNVIEVQKLLLTEYKSIDSVYTYSSSEIDSIFKLYKIHNIQHDILFSQALGRIFKADYIIQTKNIIKKNFYDISLYLFDVNLGKYVHSYSMKLNNHQPESYSDSIAAVVRSFEKYVFKSDSSVQVNKPILKNETIITHIDSLNRRYLYSGYIIIEADYSKAMVIHNGDTVCTAPVLLANISTGSHKIEVINSENKISNTFISNVNKPQMDHYFAKISPAWLTVTGNPDYAEVEIKNVKEEFLPGQEIQVTTMSFEISVKQNGYEPLTKTFNLDPFEYRMAHYNLKPKSKIKASLYSGLFPGLGQFYRDDKTSGYIYSGMGVLSILTFTAYESKFRNEIDNYNALKKQYPQSGSSVVNNKREQILKDAYNSLKKHQQNRDITIAIAAVVWAINMVDAFIWQQKPGFNGNIDITFEEVDHFDALPMFGIKYIFN